MVNWSAMQTYKDVELTDCDTRYMAGGTWRANKSKDGALHKKSGGAARAKGLGKIKICYPPFDGWKGGSPESNRGFSSPQKYPPK